MKTMPMNTHTAPSSEGTKGDLNQIAHHLFKIETPLLPEQALTTEQTYLKRLNGLLKTYREQFLQGSRVLYQSLNSTDLKSVEGQKLLATLKITLLTQLENMDQRQRIDGKPAKSFLIYDAGFTAIENEARQAVKDRLLSADAGALFEKLALAPVLRPANYALRFSYQETTVELAGAFVITEKKSPSVSDLQTQQNVGFAVLFTPVRGIEFFNSLAELDSHLLNCLKHDADRDGFLQMLPVSYHGVGVAGIWPLELSPIDSKPLFEHLYDALQEKRTLDIERALSLVDNPQHDAGLLHTALDLAIAGALADLAPRLALQAQALFERQLYLSAPDWYRSASTVRKNELTGHLNRYDQARETLLQLTGAAATPLTLARQQWLERLSDELEIDDLEPEHLLLKTKRHVAGFGVFEHRRNLIELALLGPHIDDELATSKFIRATTLSYKGAPLPETYADVTPAWLVEQAMTLQPRIDFNQVQQSLHALPAFSLAIEDMLDQRIVALAYTARLQGDLLDSDLQLIEQLREGNNARLRAATLTLHGAQLLDLWVLRQSDDNGALQRILLCTPDAPGNRCFQAFDSERACQTHILGWAKHSDDADGTRAYLLNRAPLRFRQSMQKLLSGLGFKPEDEEYKKLNFSNIGLHSDCLRAMTEHVLATRTDDYDFGTPLWYRSTTAANRRTLSTLAEEAEGTLQAFNERALSGSSFPTFDAYAHEQAKKALNTLLKRPANDVDPDTVWAYSQPSVVPSWTPAPLTYTRLYRDGYADSFGLLDAKFSRSARFKGPEGVDLSALSAENVARSVTGVWIGERYTNKVRAQLQSPASPGYGFRRSTTLAVTQRQMRGTALESHLKGHLSETDLQWLELGIASLGDSSADMRNKFVLHRLMIDGVWVIDTWLFSHGKNPVLLYTPEAPDGIGWREARLFNHLLKQEPGMIEYLTSRVAVQSRTRVRTFLEKAKKGLPQELNKTTPSVAHYDSTRSVAPVSDVRYALYDMKLQRKIDDVHATTVNRNEMIMGLIWTSIEFATAIATMPFPLLSLSSGLLLAFKDTMLALAAYKRGDTGAALQHLVGYLFNSVGALITDLRPALRSLKLYVKSARLSAAGTQADEALKLIAPLEPEIALNQGMRPVLFEGRVLWAPDKPDALGRYLLHRPDPTTGRLLSTSIPAVPDADGVMVRSRLRGGAPKYEAISETPGPHKDYGVPPKYYARVEAAMNPQMRKQLVEQSEYYMAHPLVMLDSAVQGLDSTRRVYLSQVARLTTDAGGHFANMTTLPARGNVAAISADSSFAQLIASESFVGKNLVIGARPGSIASKQALITHIDALIDKGFKHIYLEYLPGDVFALKLEKFNKGKSWRHIKKHLKTVDKALGHEADAPFSYLALVRLARKKNLKIKALDASTCYELEDVLQLADVSPLTPRSNKVRNFYSQQVIADDFADVPGERWIALVDDTRMTTFDGTPGLADLHGAVALRIDDIALDQPATISVDSIGRLVGDQAARGDYLMTLPTAYKATPPLAQATDIVSSGASHFDAFDIPLTHRKQIEVMQGQPHGMDPRYSSPSRAAKDAQTVFIEARKKLDETATDHFVDYTPPARAELPTVTESTTPDSFVKQVGDGSWPGVMVGEAHIARSSKRFLIEQLKKNKRKFKTLYMEHLLTDLHQADLDTFYRTKVMPKRLRDYLQGQDEGHMPTYTGDDTFTAVVEAAVKYGYRVRALDCVASRYVEGLSDEQLSRNRMFSYFASRVIEADQLAEGAHKWIAFIGSAHTNYNLGIPGLADMLGAVSLHVRDTTADLARSIHRGYWEVIQEGSHSITRALRSDFTLEVGIARVRPASPVAPVSRDRLTTTGHFLIERPTKVETRLVHRSRTEGIVVTPIQVDDKGLFFIDRWALTDRRFPTVEDLAKTLVTEVSLKPVT